MIATTITIAISLFIGTLAVVAMVSVALSIRRGIASGRLILRELAALEAGYRPSPPVRTLPARRKVSRQRSGRPHVQTLRVWPHCAAA